MKKWAFVIFIITLLLIIAGCEPTVQAHDKSSTTTAITDNTTDKSATNNANNTSQTTAATGNEDTLKKPLFHLYLPMHHPLKTDMLL